MSMPRLSCPRCNAAVTEAALLPHPPGGESASRALTRRYCAACGAELRLELPVRWWHALIAAAPFLVIWLKPRFVAMGMPAWAYPASLVLLLVVFMWSLQRAKRLVLVLGEARNT